MGWKLIKSVRKKADVRLITPFGLPLTIGDVIKVDKYGNFSLQGSTKTLLGIAKPARSALVEGHPTDDAWMGGKAATRTFRTDLSASTLCKGLPEGRAGFEIEFKSVDSWLLALTGRTLLTYPEAEKYRQAILDAHARGVWREDWALVTEVASADKMTFVAGTSSNTKVAVALSGKVDTATAMSAQLTAGASIAYTNNELVQSITDVPGPIGCRGLRICDEWWRFFTGGTTVGDLGAGDTQTPSQEWLDIDEPMISNAEDDDDA